VIQNKKIKQIIYEQVNWEKLLRKVLSVNSSLITSNTIVQVYMKSYFVKLFEQIEFNAERSYVCVCLYSYLILYDNKIFCRKLQNALLAMFANGLFSDLVDSKGDCNRSKMCLDIAKTLMDDIAATLFLATWPESRLNFLKYKASIFEVHLKVVKSA
jgi:hypothetical protein